LTRADLDCDTVEVWPENWQAFRLLVDVRTQWRGAGLGLDYNVLFRKMDRMGLSAAEYDDFEDDIRVMEVEAMAAMREK
jgi:hypothetical protein